MDFLGSRDLEGRTADCSTSVAFDLELMAVLALLDLDDPSPLCLAWSWRASSGACISTNWVVHRLTLLGLLCRFRRLTSALLFVGFRLSLPGLRQPILTDLNRANLQYTKWDPRLVGTVGSDSGSHYACDSECSPGTWAAPQWKTTCHVIWVPPSCQHRHGWTRRRNKLDLLTTSDFTKCPHLRPTDERYGSHKLSSLRCSNLPGKATGTVHVQTDIRTRGRRKSKWTTGGYGALRRCGCSRSGKGTQPYPRPLARLASGGMKVNGLIHYWQFLSYTWQRPLQTIEWLGKSALDTVLVKARLGATSWRSINQHATEFPGIPLTNSCLQILLVLVLDEAL